MSRITECVRIMTDITELGIPLDYPPLKELSKRMTDYVRTGDPWAGKIPFEAYKRTAHIILPKKADRQITVVLRKTN